MEKRKPITINKIKRELPTKKQRIRELWQTNEHNLWSIAEEISTTPSYVASVLQESGFISGYYDLYTEHENPINIYSAEFRGQMGYKTLETAQKSLNIIKKAYSRFDTLRDRAGQHHCLTTALTICNRAYHSGKIKEADVFRVWIMQRLAEMDPAKTTNQWGTKN